MKRTEADQASEHTDSANIVMPTQVGCLTLCMLRPRPSSLLCQVLLGPGEAFCPAVLGLNLRKDETGYGLLSVLG